MFVDGSRVLDGVGTGSGGCFWAWLDGGEETLGYNASVRLSQWLLLFGGIGCGIFGYLVGFQKIGHVSSLWGIPLVIGGAAMLMALKNEQDINPPS
jgi:hypothetical protein